MMYFILNISISSLEALPGRYNLNENKIENKNWNEINNYVIFLSIKMHQTKGYQTHSQANIWVSPRMSKWIFHRSLIRLY